MAALAACMRWAALGFLFVFRLHACRGFDVLENTVFYGLAAAAVE